MFCSTLANKIINKIIKSVVKLEIQILIKNHPSPPPHPPTKVKGKVQQTFRPKIPSAAHDLAPQTETTTVCLVFCINPSSMLYLLSELFNTSKRQVFKCLGALALCL